MLDDQTKFCLKEVFGYVGTILLVLVFIPQVVRVYRLREVRALSSIFLVLNWFGAACWMIYGAIIPEWPIIISNVVIFICINLLLLAKWLFREKEDDQLTEIEEVITDDQEPKI